MRKERLTGADYFNLISAAARSLERNKAEVNSLNVFPVPDGDTGTNMSLTLKSAVAEAKKVATDSIGKVAQAVSLGSLMGARGNSGVILSQIYRGIAKGLEDKESATPVELAWALQEGVRTAYKAVMKPVEGTVLTVVRESAKGALDAARRGGDIVEVWAKALEAGEAALQKTPDLLPVLKQAGVVDAGGKGLIYILNAGLDVLQDRVEADEDAGSSRKVQFEVTDEMADLRYPYDTQFLLKGSQIPVDTIRNHLEAYGDSLLVVGSAEMVRVHIHTANPGTVLQYCLGFGTLSAIEIENMIEQALELKDSSPAEQREVPAFSVPVQAQGPKEIGVAAVAVGDGLTEIFRSLGADQIINGGQTMNPATEDVLRAIENVPADKVIVLPNNKNVILSAEQAKKLSKKEVYVVPSRNVPQGIAALLSYRPEGDVREIASMMNRALSSIKDGEVTYAVRDTRYNGLEISTGDILGLSNGEIISVGKHPDEVLQALIDSIIEDGDEVITLLYGEGIDSEQAGKIGEIIGNKYPDVEIEVRYGGQPLYYYIVSIE
ncbi:MAG: DAK2 domain-containing protein [Bacillota bacterium]